MPDYNFLMDSRLAPAQSRVVSQMGRLAATQGLNLYLAGGAVRDLTLGAELPRGLEFVVEGNIQKLVRPLTSGVKTKPRPAGAVPEEPIDLKVEKIAVDAPHNRAEVVFEGGVPGEIAGARNETYTTPGRPPAISPGTIFDDLRRRDFSANAMAISLHPFSRGLLLDPTNGASDLERKELRALHSRSFFDDPSRIYRLIRLSIRLDFKPDEKTTRWLDAALAEKVWEHLREEQQGRELRAILEEDSCGKILKTLRDRELLGGLDRKLATARLEFDRFERVRNAVHTASETNMLFPNFLTTVEKLPGGERARLAKKVFGDAKTVKFVLGLDHEAAKLGRVLGSSKAAKASQVYSILLAAPSPLPALLLAQNPPAAVQNRIKAFFTKFPEVRLAGPRAELEAMGMPAGAKFEDVLEKIFLEQLDGKLKTPPQITKALRSYSGIKEPPPAPPPQAPKAAKGAAAAGRPPRFGTTVPGPKPPAPVPPAKPAVAAKGAFAGKPVTPAPPPATAKAAPAVVPAAPSPSARKPARATSAPPAPAAKPASARPSKPAKAPAKAAKPEKAAKPVKKAAKGSAHR